MKIDLNAEAKRLSDKFIREHQKWLETEVRTELLRCNFTFKAHFHVVWDTLHYLGWRCVEQTTGPIGNRVEFNLYAPGGRLVASRSLNPWRPSVAF